MSKIFRSLVLVATVLVATFLLGMFQLSAQAETEQPTGSKKQKGTVLSTVSGGVLSVTRDDIGLFMVPVNGGFSYAHPITDSFSVGGFGGFRILIPIRTIGFTAPTEDGFTSFLGVGLSLGPYFRLRLWGKEKQGGLGLAPYFTFNYFIIRSFYMLGGGLMVDVLFTKNFIINLGFEILTSGGQQFAGLVGPGAYIGLSFNIG